MVTLKKLSDKTIIGQLYFVSVHMDDVFTLDQKEKFVRRYFKEFPPGGIFIQGGTVEQVLEFVRWVQGKVKVPLWIAGDIERGVGGAFRGGTAFPHQAMWGAADDYQLIYESGKVIGKEARVIGINMLFAPVVDLLTDASVINIRAFHEDPQKVIDMASAFISGVMEEGVFCVIKHFPGHGAVKEDSHVITPHLAVENIFQSKHILPFLELKERFHYLGIMTSHLNYDNQLITFHSTLLQEFSSNYQMSPLWISDDLTMKGAGFKNREFAVRDFFQSGHHHGLNPPHYNLAAAQLYQLSQKEKQLRDEIYARVQQILTYKKNFISSVFREPRLPRMMKHIQKREHKGLALKLTRKGIVVLKKRTFTHVNQNQKIVHYIFTHSGEESSTLVAFRKLLQDYSSKYEEKTNTNSFPKTQGKRIFSFYQRVYGGVKVEPLSEEKIQLLEQKLIPEDMILIWGNPFPFKLLIERVNCTVIWIPSYMYVAQHAAFEAIIGKTKIEGNNPAKSQFSGISQEDNIIPARKVEPEILPHPGEQLQFALQKYLLENAYTGAILAHYEGAQCYIATVGEPVNNRLQPIKLNEKTYFDLASLTKIIVTTPLILHLISRGLIDFNTPLSYFYPISDTSRKRITIQQLLTHSSGFPAWKPFFKTCSTGDEVIHSILETPLMHAPGEKIIYSDLGYILLGDIIEKILDKSLREAFRDILSGPLEMSDDLFYLSGNRFRKNTFVCSRMDWKTKMHPLHFVHDENARLFPNGAGHAGLFGNVLGIIRFVQFLFEEGRWFEHKIINELILKQSWNRITDSFGQSRAIGWDVPTRPSQAGKEYENKNSFGHLAYTGCSLWFDVRRKKATLLLTNRTCTDFPVDKFRKIRRKLYTLAVKLK